MILVAIDPGTRCGWCIHDTREDWWHSGTWNLKGSRFEGAGMRFVRFRSLFRELLANANHPDLVAYEEVRRHMGVDAAHVYGGLVAVLQEVCETEPVPYLGIPVGTVKRAATGRGNASKDDMLAAARERWAGWDGDDNEADARWIAVAAAKEVKCE
jgi:Holliday junction resolvasome RuvABC endonuclease subunit